MSFADLAGHLSKCHKIIFRTFCKADSSHIRYADFGTLLAVRRNFDQQLAAFLRKQRGSLSYADFSKQVGVSHTTLHRLERGEHHLTLIKLEKILDRLKLKLRDVFPGEY